MDTAGRPGRDELLVSADSLARRLDALAGELDERERDLLGALIVRAMNPLERMRHLEPEGLLSRAELRTLGGLPEPVED